jgi:hypothetical protein
MATTTPIKFVFTGATALRLGKAVLVTVAPALVILTTGVGAYLAGPNTADPKFQTEYQAFFSATAVLLGTVFVTLVVQASFFRSKIVRPAAIVGACYIVLGEVAALISLSPGLDPVVAHIAFAATVSAGAASLAAVLFSAIRSLATPPFELGRDSQGRSVLSSGLQLAGTAAGGPSFEARTTPDQARAARAPLAVEFMPEAAKDLKNLGGLTERTVGWLLQRLFSDPVELAARSHRLAGPDRRYVVPLGSVRAIYRLLNDSEPAGSERNRVIIDRIVRNRSVKQVVEQLRDRARADAAHQRDADE